MSLLLLFAYTNLAPSVPISELIETAPSAGNGFAIQRPASAGEWRWVVELADPADGDAVLWRDITGYYVGDRHQFGADTYKGDARARLVSVQLQIDDSDMLAPWGQDTSSIFGVDVRLDAGMLMRAGMTRVVSSVVEEWEPIWTGRVESWGDESGARGQVRRHVVNVVDTMSDLANVPVIMPDSTDEWDTWFTSYLLPAANWLFGVDIYGDTTDAGLPGVEAATAAINLMDAGTDPLGLVWRTLRTGRMVIHPAPWDTTNTNRYLNPLLDVYPDGLKFNYSPDFTDIEYIADDDQQSFGIERTVAGILNSFVVTWPDGFDTETYAIDDPVSIARYGVRPFTATWILSNPPVVDDLMADRAYANAQALPLRTTLDLEGFWSALAIVDHLDPVTVVYATSDEGLVVTATGTVRNIVEERTFRGEAGGDYALSWQSTVQLDLDATETSAALLPVEDLMLVATESPLLGTSSFAEFSWTNPTQPDITPTEVQMRMLNRSFIWFSKDYPGVGADGAVIGSLVPATSYTFQVRLIRRVNGVVVAASAVRQVRFTTPALIYPTPVEGDDPTDTNVDMDDVPFGDCEDDVSIELQEQTEIGGAWVTVDTFSGAEIVLVDGIWHLVDDIPNSFFNDGSMYRFLGFCGAELIIVGQPFDPPDDWTDPCTTPPALSVPPFDESSLLVYVPMICAPDTIKEYVSGLVAVHGPALDQIGSLLGGDPEQRALLAIADPEWSDAPAGILAYGECPQIVGHVGDRTISVRVMVDTALDCVLFECGGMRLTCVEVSGGWRAAVIVYKAGLTITLPTDTILAEGTAYVITATHELATGDIRIYVDGNEDNSVAGSDNVNIIAALPIWRVGAPPESWITDCALWSEVVALVPTDGFLPAAILALSPLSYWKLRGNDANTLHDFGSLALDLTNSGMTLDNSAGLDGYNYPQKSTPDAAFLDGSDSIDYEPQNAGGLTVFYLVKGQSGGEGGSSYQTVSKLDQTNAGSWRHAISTGTASGYFARTITNAAGTARTRTDTGTMSVDTWHICVTRFGAGASDFPGVRVDGSNITGSTGGSGSGDSNSSQSVKLYGHGGSTGRFLGTLAHVAIFAGQLSDGDCAVLEAAAAADGW